LCIKRGKSARIRKGEAGKGGFCVGITRVSSVAAAVPAALFFIGGGKRVFPAFIWDVGFSLDNPAKKDYKCFTNFN